MGGLFGGGEWGVAAGAGSCAGSMYLEKYVQQAQSATCTLYM